MTNFHRQQFSHNLSHPFMIAQLTTIGWNNADLPSQSISSLCFKGAFQTTKYDDGIIVPKLFYSKVGPAGGQPGGQECAECVLTVEDLSLALTEDTSQAKILTDTGTTGTTGTTGNNVILRTFLQPCERPEAPLVAHYQPSVPVSQVWDREYRISHFERIVYPQSFR